MSAARDNFLDNLAGLIEAVDLQSGVKGATGIHISAGITVLRRGISVAALVMFETFIRDRTEELLNDLGGWPAQFADLPQGIRDASQLHALTHLQRYANMLKREEMDYEVELKDELAKMASTSGASRRFTRFVSGDYTGNISPESFKDLLGIFQIKDCWASFQKFSSEIGFGVPNTREQLSNVIRKRHKSAHTSKHTPTTADLTIHQLR